MEKRKKIIAILIALIIVCVAIQVINPVSAASDKKQPLIRVLHHLKIPIQQK